MDSFFNCLDLIQPLQCIEMEKFSFSPICVCGLLKYKIVSSIWRNLLTRKDGCIIFSDRILDTHCSTFTDRYSAITG